MNNVRTSSFKKYFRNSLTFSQLVLHIVDIGANDVFIYENSCRFNVSIRFIMSSKDAEIEILNDLASCIQFIYLLFSDSDSSYRQSCFQIKLLSYVTSTSINKKYAFTSETKITIFFNSGKNPNAMFIKIYKQ
jgi:hypothetical protein